MSIYEIACSIPDDHTGVSVCKSYDAEANDAEKHADAFHTCAKLLARMIYGTDSKNRITEDALPLEVIGKRFRYCNRGQRFIEDGYTLIVFRNDYLDGFSEMAIVMQPSKGATL